LSGHLAGEVVPRLGGWFRRGRDPGRGERQGFVGGANDTATGLTNLGARQYQPGTGSFISPDPLLKPYDPQNLNAYAYAYAYAYGNPSTYSDPSGAMLCDPDGKCGSRQALDKYASAQSGDANPRPKGSSCPPTELTCVVPLPLTNAGRTSHQKPAWIKHAPVTRPKKAADNPRPVSCGAMSIHVGTCIDTAGGGSGIWNFIKHSGQGSTHAGRESIIRQSAYTHPYQGQLTQ
jgi:RHS repeat-associated protein